MTTRAQIQPALIELKAKRSANRDQTGRIKNLSLDLRLQAEERRLVIACLDMAPETVDNRYAAETGELLSLLFNPLALMD